MKKIIKNMDWRLFILTLVVCLIVWPLLDMVWANFITHSAFQYNIRDHIIDPIITAVIIHLAQAVLKMKKQESK